jgi:hypothetical protein
VAFDLRPLDAGPPELKVRDVIVRVYIKNAAVFVNEKLNIFIHYIVKEVNEQNSLPMMTALLLSLEQLIFNESNPNRVVPGTQSVISMGSKFYQQIIDKVSA